MSFPQHNSLKNQLTKKTIAFEVSEGRFLKGEEIFFPEGPNIVSSLRKVAQLARKAEFL